MTTPPASKSVKTLALRLPPDLHAQITLVAMIDGISANDLVRNAIEETLKVRLAEGGLAERASEALEAMDREAAARREALQALLAGPATEVPDASAEATAEVATPAPKPAPTRGEGRRR